jgi:hypothetical protein
VRRLAAALCCLAACSSRSPSPGPTAASGPPAEREVTRKVAELVDPPAGLAPANGGPFCALVERTGGTYGKPRYQVRVSTKSADGDLLTTRANEKRAVVWLVQVEAGGRRFDGFVSPAKARQHESGLWYTPPVSLRTRFEDLPMQPENTAGIQEVPSDLQACRLTPTLPDAPAVALGGRLLGDYDGTDVVLDPDGVRRPIEER